MLNHPFLDQPYVPRIGHFLGGIEIYDREETLGEQLWQLDPNEKNDRDTIIKNYIIPDLKYLSYRHKYVLLKLLESSILDTNFDFSSVFQSNPDEHTSLAWEGSELESARSFFEDIFRIAETLWKDDLDKAKNEDQSVW